jgi:hypothetical protein
MEILSSTAEMATYLIDVVAMFAGQRLRNMHGRMWPEKGRRRRG